MRKIFGLFLLAVFCFVSSAWAVTYELQYLGEGMIPAAINDRYIDDGEDNGDDGDIAGYYEDGDGFFRWGHQWSCGGKFFTLMTLKGTDARPYGINYNGKVVGSYRDKEGVKKACYWVLDYDFNSSSCIGWPMELFEGTVAADINKKRIVAGHYETKDRIVPVMWNGLYPDSDSTLVRKELYIGDAKYGWACGINDAGFIVGARGDNRSGAGSQGCIWNVNSPDQVEDIGISTPKDVNNANEVVGNNGQQPFFWSRERGTVPLKCSGEGKANAINNYGVIVGSSLKNYGCCCDPDCFDIRESATLWQGPDEPQDLNKLVVNAGGFHFEEAIGINDRGQIIAIAERDGKKHGVILSPVAETSAPKIQLSANFLDFGQVVVGEEEYRSVEAKNVGSADLTIDLLLSEAGNFELSWNTTCSLLWGPAVLKPGESCTIWVLFTPLAQGKLTSSLEIYSNDPQNSLISVQLKGEGVRDAAFWDWDGEWRNDVGQTFFIQAYAADKSATVFVADKNSVYIFRDDDVSDGWFEAWDSKGNYLNVVFYLPWMNRDCRRIKSPQATKKVAVRPQLCAFYNGKKTDFVLKLEYK